jgi:stage V sporulation protein D (sporulation-specific penicillin-binding protein)
MDVYRVDLDLNYMRQSINPQNNLSDAAIDNKLSERSKLLADTLGMKFEDVDKKLKQTLKDGKAPGSVNLIRRIEKDQADKVEALRINKSKIAGVMISPDTKRVYPNDNFLSQVLGFTGSDGKGIYGVEKIYDKELTGIPGKRIAEVDRETGDELPYSASSYTKPADGKDVVLTIDAVIQQMSENVADKAMKDDKAKSVSIIVSDPSNGEILAMVNKPDYNPNDPSPSGKTTGELLQLWKNRAVNDTFEPGSILKVITAAAAMQENLVTENSQFVCNGSLKFGPDIIHCDDLDGHGKENFVDIIKNSCNVGFMELGEKLGNQKLTDYIKLFGFGQTTGIDLNGEAIGIVQKPDKMRPVDLATLSFGQGDSVSCVQYIAAFNAVANGGTWIRPHVMKELTHVDENDKKIVDSTYKDLGSKKILDSDKMAQLRSYLEKVVTDGTGTSAFVEGYHIAGKTGTANKVINGKYADGKYVASFAGMVPEDNPKFTILVSVDEPDVAKHFAAETAAPASRELFLDIFNHLALNPDGSFQSIARDVVVPEIRGLKKEDAINILADMHITYDIDDKGEFITNMSILPGSVVKEGSKIQIASGAQQAVSDIVLMPNLSGYTKDKAEEILNKLGIKVNFQGDGAVKTQDFTAGKQINKGTTVNIQLEKSVD